VVRSRQQFRKLVSVAVFDLTRLPRLRVDFRREIALLIAIGPRSSTGWRLRVVSVGERGDTLHVVVQQLYPTLRDHVAVGVVSPYVLLVFPRRKWSNFDVHYAASQAA